jgi:hypothetical protein
MMPAPHSLEDRRTVQLRCDKAGQTTLAAKKRRARIARAGASFVTVGIGDNANAIALLEGIVHDPLECAPGRVHLDSGLQLSIVGIVDIGVAPSDMGDDDAILAFELIKQIMGGMGVGAFVIHVGQIGNLRMRRSMDRFALAKVVYVAIPADGRIG